MTGISAESQRLGITAKDIPETDRGFGLAEEGSLRKV